MHRPAIRTFRANAIHRQILADDANPDSTADIRRPAGSRHCHSDRFGSRIPQDETGSSIVRCLTSLEALFGALAEAALIRSWLAGPSLDFTFGLPLQIQRSAPYTV